MISIHRRIRFATLLPLILITPILVPIVRGAAQSSSPNKEESLQLPKLTVKGEALCSYGFGIIFSRDHTTTKVKRVFIKEVIPGSIAEQQGLHEGDEILSINGVNVAGMEGEIQKGKQLFDLLAEQHPGKTIDLDVVVRVTKKFTLRASGF